jgi:hypothetical protein
MAEVISLDPVGVISLDPVGVISLDPVGVTSAVPETSEVPGVVIALFSAVTLD